MTLLTILEAYRLCGGRIKKTRLERGSSWEAPQVHAEVRVLWSGRLVSSGACFQPEVEFTFTAGDAALPTFWNEAVVGRMALHETAELVVSPELGYGADGAPSLGVPADAHLPFDTVGHTT